MFHLKLKQLKGNINVLLKDYMEQNTGKKILLRHYKLKFKNSNTSNLEKVVDTLNEEEGPFHKLVVNENKSYRHIFPNQTNEKYF